MIRDAPARLIRSGVGDILAKYTALADWRIAHIVTKVRFHALHGEKTGAGAVLASREYHRLASMDPLQIKEFSPLDNAAIDAFLEKN